MAGNRTERTVKVLTGVILSYVQANGKTGREHIMRLRRYLDQRFGISVDPRTLRSKVISAKNKIRRRKALDRAESRLLAPDGKMRKYRYADPYCPVCWMFKNFEKECPYCEHHQMTL